MNNIYEQKGVFGDKDKFFNSSNRLQKMLELAKSLENAPQQILDIGGGTGYFSMLVKDIYPASSVYCVDISANALAEGKQNYPGINFIQADAEVKLPFENEFFDLVISGEHIEHLKDVDTYLIEINRVMKDKGVLILTTPNLASWFNRILLLFGRQPFWLEPSLIKILPIINIFGKTFPEKLSGLPSGHLRLFTLDTLKKLLMAYRFSIKQVKGTRLFSNPAVKPFDSFFSYFPSLAISLVVKANKTNLHES